VNSRELSEALDALASRLESVVDSDDPATVLEVAQELRRLSNEKYAPGNSATWAEIQPKKAKKTFTDKTGRKMPF